MNVPEVVQILAEAAKHDYRKPSKAQAEAWQEILAPYDFADAMVAVRVHYTHSTDRLMVAHLVNRMDAWDQDWLNAGRDGPRPPGWPEVRQLAPLTDAQRAAMLGAAQRAIEADK